MLVNLNIVKMKKDLIYYFDMLKDKSAYELGSSLFGKYPNGVSNLLQQ